MRDAEHAARRDARGCPHCGLEGHEPDAVHCRHCGDKLPPAFNI
jgi:voltage-gated potassium channel